MWLFLGICITLLMLLMYFEGDYDEQASYGTETTLLLPYYENGYDNDEEKHGFIYLYGAPEFGFCDKIFYDLTPYFGGCLSSMNGDVSVGYIGNMSIEWREFTINEK
jgi:hypothetical protein